LSICIYLAGPLFSEAERQFNKKFKLILTKNGFNVFLPQENEVYGCDTKNEQMFSNYLNILNKCDIIVAVLDGGLDVDSGTAWEVGYAYSKGIPIFGLRTDFRTFDDSSKINLMIEECLTYLATDIEDLVKILNKSLIKSNK